MNIIDDTKIVHSVGNFNIPKSWVILNELEVSNNIITPKRKSLAVIKINEKYYLAFIVDGADFRNGRVSNTWRVRIVKSNKTLSKEIPFLYGNFYKYKGPLKIKTTITHKII